MVQVLRQLIQLTECDDAITAATNRFRAAKALVPNAEKAREDAQALEDRVRAELSTHNDTLHGKEREVEQYRKRLQRARHALETGTGDPEAAERQRVQCIDILDDLETVVLELMDGQDGLNGRLAAAEAVVAAKTTAIDDAGAEAPPKITDEATTIRRLRKERDALRPLIHEIEVKRYDSLRARRKRPVTPLIDKACKSCNRVIVANRLQEIAKGRLEACGGCGRWLFDPEQLDED